MNNFILNYSPLMMSPTPGQLLNHIQVNRFISQYYQPYVGTYLIKSDQNHITLNDSFKGLFEANVYMLTAYDARFASGSLPQEIWNWINFGSVPNEAPTNAWLAALTNTHND